MWTRASRSIVTIFCAATLAVPTGIAQSGGSGSPSGGQGGGGAQAPSSSPAGGLSGGTAPIETTLFAYRALQSDAEAIAAKVVNSGTGERIVIGTQADVAAFLQWRTVLGQSDLFGSELAAMHLSLARLNGSYRRAAPLASLSIAKTHTGNFAKGGTGSYTILVTNSAAASATTGAVLVTDTPPDGLTITAMTGKGWQCNVGGAPANSCMRSDSLGPAAAYDPITVQVSVAAGAADSVVNTATVAGGNSATASATDTTKLVAQVTLLPGRGGLLLDRNRALDNTGGGGGGAAANAGGGGTGSGSSTPPPTPFATALSAIPTFTALAQFIATSFAVNQTLSPWQGNMSDLPLINWVAGILRRHGRTVLIPSTYPPLAMTDKDLYGTYFLQKILALRDARLYLWDDLQTANALLMDANFVIQNPTKYSAGSLNDALEYAGKAQSLLISAQNLASSVDAFVANLFGGQAPSGGAAPAAGGAASPTASGGGGGNSPAAGGNGTNGSGAPSGSSSPAAGGAGGGGGGQNSTAPSAAPQQTPLSLQQILASDFLAQRLFNGKATVDPGDIDSLSFLTLHAEESGGSELVKSNIFYGNHIFFSGGSVATFSVYRLKGDVECSGTAYNYFGNVREKNVEQRLAADDIGHEAKIPNFSCVDRRVRTEVHEGMSRADVESAFGKPDESFQKRSIYLYRSRNTLVEFRKGVVYKISAAGAAAPQQAGSPD